MATVNLLSSKDFDLMLVFALSKSAGLMGQLQLLGPLYPGSTYTFAGGGVAAAPVVVVADDVVVVEVMVVELVDVAFMVGSLTFTFTLSPVGVTPVVVVVEMVVVVTSAAGAGAGGGVVE